MNLLCPCKHQLRIPEPFFFERDSLSSNAFKTTKHQVFHGFSPSMQNGISLMWGKKKSWPGWAVWRILIHQTSGKPPRFRSSPEVLETYTPSHEQFVSPQVTGANKPSPNQNSSCNSPNIWASNIHSFSPWIVRVFLERILQPYSRWGRQWSCDTHTRTTIAILTGLN